MGIKLHLVKDGKAICGREIGDPFDYWPIEATEFCHFCRKKDDTFSFRHALGFNFEVAMRKSGGEAIGDWSREGQP